MTYTTLRVIKMKFFLGKSRLQDSLTVAVFISALLPSVGAIAAPQVTRLWLVDAATDVRIQELEDFQSLPLPVLSNALSIEAEVNGETESVAMRINGVESSLENLAPYSLVGDASGDFNAAPQLQTPGWIKISAEPFSENNSGGMAGVEHEINLYLFQPNFFVNNPLDKHDYDPGDGVCSITKPLTLTDFVTVPVPIPAMDPKIFSEFQVPLPGKTTPPRKTELQNIDLGRFNDLGLQIPPQASRIPDDFKAPPIYTKGCTLRAAIEEANAYPGTQSILVDGRKSPFKLTEGQLDITTPMTIKGYEMPVIDARKASRVFYVDGGGASMIVNLSGLDMARGEAFSGARGGAIQVNNNAYLQITDSIVRESRANFGGGIYLQNGGDLRLIRSAVRDNVAGHPESFGGGGVTQRGGGIYNLEGTVYIIDSSVFDNLAVRGGGLSNKGGLMRIENSTIADNEAVSIGGGIENQNNGDANADLHIAFSTITRNTAGTSGSAPVEQRKGGGLYNTGRAYMASSILAENTDPWYSGYQHHAPDCFSPDMYQFKSYRNNIVGVLNEQCSLTDYSWGNTAWFDFGSADSPLDPGLGSRSMWDHLAYFSLLASSIAIDNGAPATASLYPCEDHDMRGRPRPVGAGCDIGAMERQ